MTQFETAYNQLNKVFSVKDFQLNSERNIDYFPDHLEKILDDYFNIYTNKYEDIIESYVPFDTGNNKIVTKKLEILIPAIKDTVKLYYEGKISKASECFFEALNSIIFEEIKPYEELKETKNFYRARSGSSAHFTKKDLFHINFEKRHHVKTNRFSVTGFPALYFGDSTYVCWEEFNKHSLRDLWFSRVENKENLKIIEIQRIEDLVSNLEDVPKYLKLTFLLRYILTFPLTIASTVKVKNDGAFKPEYIIPQLLLEYITNNEEIDGIKFPSSKVDYEKLYNIPAYNYVFPAKAISKTGYCKKLKSIFHLTEPTSLEIEEIIYNPSHNTAVHGYIKTDDKKIELVKGVKSDYVNTSFGKLESRLNSREVSEI